MTRGVILRPGLLEAGHSDTELLRLRRRGDLVAVRGGAYLPRGDDALERPEDVHRALIAATLTKFGGPAVVSHVSAAVLHGLRIWDLPLDRVHVTRDGRRGGRVSGRLHLHCSPLSDEEVVDVDGVAVTSLARTVIDMALTVPFERAVVVADSACREAAFPAALLVAAEGLAGRPGNAAALRAIRFAEPGSQSVGETLSRTAIIRAGLPRPLLQWRVNAAADGRFIGDTDFGWEQHRTVGEFDGLVKYGRLVKDGQVPADVVVAEKIREDALRDEGLSVVRWRWAELFPFDGVVERLRRGFRRAR